MFGRSCTINLVHYVTSSVLRLIKSNSVTVAEFSIQIDQKTLLLPSEHTLVSNSH